ncbi:MAG: glycosyltransferase [Oculatellaceae cyanobacterium Prado106]|jgi:glycosyltransferase involved in cell wall biosynthesis|nr:glycosyltransferase [Oculatellaceae cyanobacterium Prado106]
MAKLLAIAIPTYNRADLLDKQLGWLAEAIRGHEADCEIWVSDNASTDDTPLVIEKWRQYWQQRVGDSFFRSQRHPQNLGVIKNIASCLTLPKTDYVWAIGDDDPIQDRAIPYVIAQLKQQPEPTLVLLNFSGRNKLTGEAVHPPTIQDNRWFDVDTAFQPEAGLPDRYPDSKAVFQYCYEKSVGAVIFLTASIYRTSQIQKAFEHWPTAAENWIFMAYLAGYCAAQGAVVVTQEPFLECIVGVSYWQREQQSALLMQYKHTSEVLIKLGEITYPTEFCQRMIVKQAKAANVKVLLGALRRWPQLTLKTVVPFWRLAFSSALWLITHPTKMDEAPPKALL